jgi:hypothetical protein
MLLHTFYNWRLSHPSTDAPNLSKDALAGCERPSGFQADGKTMLMDMSLAFRSATAGPAATTGPAAAGSNAAAGAATTTRATATAEPAAAGRLEIPELPESRHSHHGQSGSDAQDPRNRH